MTSMKQSVCAVLFWSGVSGFFSGCSFEGGESYTPAPFTATSRPYSIRGTWYYPQQHYELEEEGVASCYGVGDGCHGALTATGDRFNANAMTAAHKTAVLPSIMEVRNMANGRSIRVLVNDRGPFHGDRILDLSRGAAEKLGFYKNGVARVSIKTLVPESLSFAQRYKPGQHSIEGTVERAFYQNIVKKVSGKSLSEKHRNALRLLEKKAPSAPSREHPVYVEVLMPHHKYIQAIRRYFSPQKICIFQKNSAVKPFLYKVVLGPFYGKAVLAPVMKHLCQYKKCRVRFLNRPVVKK